METSSMETRDVETLNDVARQVEARQVESSDLSGVQLLYNKPEILNSNVHADWGLETPEQPFAFAAKEHLLPLLVHEIAQAAQWYPVIFAGEQRFPLAVMGIKPQHNLFIRSNGEVEPGAYLPAYVRRYPFTLAEDAEQQLVVCIDTGGDHLRKSGTVPLFENGEPTEKLRGAIDFCNEFERSRQKTVEFVALLESLDLFEVKHTLYTPNRTVDKVGTIKALAEYYAVSESKLNALPAATLSELAGNGALSQIYAHLHSLLRWEQLMIRYRQPMHSPGNC